MIKTTLGINGMACGMCESHINDVVRRNFKVKKVSSSFKNALAKLSVKSRLTKKKSEKPSVTPDMM